MNKGLEKEKKILCLLDDVWRNTNDIRRQGVKKEIGFINWGTYRIYLLRLESAGLVLSRKGKNRKEYKINESTQD